MNEQLFASRIRLALDETAERLPYRIAQRLESARTAALTRALPASRTAVSVTGGSAALHGIGDDPPSGWVRLLSTVIPLLLVVAGLYGISVWEDSQRAAETADIDAALVLSDDEVPLEAYADRGFGTYIRNVRQ